MVPKLYTYGGYNLLHTPFDMEIGLMRLIWKQIYETNEVKRHWIETSFIRHP